MVFFTDFDRSFSLDFDLPHCYSPYLRIYAGSEDSSSNDEGSFFERTGNEREARMSMNMNISENEVGVICKKSWSPPCECDSERKSSDIWRRETLDEIDEKLRAVEQREDQISRAVSRMKHEIRESHSRKSSDIWRREALDEKLCAAEQRADQISRAVSRMKHEIRDISEKLFAEMHEYDLVEKEDDDIPLLEDAPPTDEIPAKDYLDAPMHEYELVEKEDSSNEPAMSAKRNAMDPSRESQIISKLREFYKHQPQCMNCIESIHICLETNDEGNILIYFKLSSGWDLDAIDVNVDTAEEYLNDFLNQEDNLAKMAGKPLELLVGKCSESNAFRAN